MPSLALITTLDGSTAPIVHAPAQCLPQKLPEQKQGIKATETPPVSTAAPKNPFSTKPASGRAFPPLPVAKNNAKDLEIATRLWSPTGHQTSQFRAAVCTCLSLGLSRADIACHIRQAACTTPILEKNKTEDFLYRSIYGTVYRIDSLTKNCVSKEENKRIMTNAKSVSISRLAENFMGLDLEKERQKEAANGIEEKALEMLQVILDVSHRQSGALSPDLGTSVSESAAASKHRVKMMIEQPDQAKAFIRMVLRNDPDTDSRKLLNMMDFYSIWE
jgi:hypothetical protein